MPRKATTKGQNRRAAGACRGWLRAGLTGDQLGLGGTALHEVADDLAEPRVLAQTVGLVDHEELGGLQLEPGLHADVPGVDGELLVHM